jgi:hypothetical protein
MIASAEQAQRAWWNQRGVLEMLVLLGPLAAVALIFSLA